MILYREYPPRPALRAHVDCLWTCSMPPLDAPNGHQVLPDNCLDILWQDLAPYGVVSGMMSSGITVLTSMPRQTVAVRFKPGRAAAFFDLPLYDLADSHVELPNLWGRARTEQLAQALWADSLDDGARLDLIQDDLLAHLRQKRLAAHHRGQVHCASELALAAVGALEASGGSLRIAALAAQLGVSRQHLAAQFRQQVGLPAKLFARVCRFQRVRQALRSQVAADVDWAALALQHGYFDQAHLIHDFQALSRRTPQTHARG